ncbi:MAG: hypothetical protein DRP72_02975 [Candidatus Omnitrophota bacterium]|nr:MAG: hypothetical protein DRP72_02975 [Candidatus Omnitrophota bacterium]
MLAKYVINIGLGATATFRIDGIEIVENVSKSFVMQEKYPITRQNWGNIEPVQKVYDLLRNDSLVTITGIVQADSRTDKSYTYAHQVIDDLRGVLNATIIQPGTPTEEKTLVGSLYIWPDTSYDFDTKSWSTPSSDQVVLQWVDCAYLQKMQVKSRAEQIKESHGLPEYYDVVLAFLKAEYI